MRFLGLKITYSFDVLELRIRKSEVSKLSIGLLIDLIKNISLYVEVQMSSYWKLIELGKFFSISEGQIS